MYAGVSACSRRTMFTPIFRKVNEAKMMSVSTDPTNMYGKKVLHVAPLTPLNITRPITASAQSTSVSMIAIHGGQRAAASALSHVSLLPSGSAASAFCTTERA